MSQLSLSHKHERFTANGKNAMFVAGKKRKRKRGEGGGRGRKREKKREEKKGGGKEEIDYFMSY